jgi:hypothetical protein
MTRQERISASLELLYITNHAGVVDIGYIELFEKFNGNNTNYTGVFEP